MLLQIQLPNRDQALAFNRQRWAEVLEERQWDDLPYRIETNAFGQIIMSPPPELSHGSRQFRIAKILEQLLGGRGITECPISTADGVKAADAAWYSVLRYEQVRGQQIAAVAPEICVEVLSPSNTSTEMQIKRELYFDSGASECWTCDLDGRMAFYHLQQPATAKHRSALCPDFPCIIED